MQAGTAIPRIEQCHDNPLAPASSRFAIGRTPTQPSTEAPSGPATRPLGLRFARPAPRLADAALPAHRYCHDRQMAVAVATGQPLWAVQHTTIGSKDGQGTPQEDWKPDL